MKMKWQNKPFPGRCKWGAFDGFRNSRYMPTAKKETGRSFIEAGAPEQANELYEYMLKELQKLFQLFSMVFLALI